MLIQRDCGWGGVQPSSAPRIRASDAVVEIGAGNERPVLEDASGCFEHSTLQPQTMDCPSSRPIVTAEYPTRCSVAPVGTASSERLGTGQLLPLRQIGSLTLPRRRPEARARPGKFGILPMAPRVAP